MFTIAQHVFHLLFTKLRSRVTGVWSFITRLLHGDAPAAHVNKQDSPKTQSSSAEVQDSPQATPSPKYPQVIQYVHIPGEWQRKLYPHWPESAFKVPDPVPEGPIYYITKGDYVRRGATALVERLPTGHISKTPLPNPYNPYEEQRDRQSMQHEYDVYCFIGPSPFIPTVINWDSESKVLVLEDYANGDLETYLRNHGDTDADTRRKWALQAAQALESLHNIGVIHQDITPRNFLLDKNLDLGICDFAGSSFPGHTASTGAPGPRYQSRAWGRGYIPSQADDIFSLGSLMYFIMGGEEPYSELDEEEVERCFENLDFPASDHLGCGTVIQNCWDGRFTTAEKVVQGLVEAGETNRV
ncbi:hypothetical protein H634G_03298 [Metarhizium anisopliae BRIP 53293]|uniref:EKC/KEOPS complex subunit BUD32 n=1 Tax=Metarhizium anisopliae BRIP 53293 TaxID=1291518 RepID=A0A0D9P4Z9_METAN|nr:hypothetical protein H634G_03298 [Metarhizium anisopliae BRIP 53293]KJK90284.1 hypothetical protein H633G_05851 [Metarhizium anisopliae BRIP 53284]